MFLVAVQAASRPIAARPARSIPCRNPQGSGFQFPARRETPPKLSRDPEEFEIRPAADRFPGLLFVRVDEAKATKNRLHLDFRPDDQTREVDRLLDLGASRADIGQGRQTWVVLADPEGNEFCVLSSRAQ